ncbi:FAD-binding protein [Gluconobacter oxydans]|uniref:FAD-binding protein n=1 Tax=Gluconobacter oxydans TaxID=442 RepID=UPI000781D21D|nr:FAD-binding protein [Gluconobacter oxydans]KXV12591.1 hypothetical protein AD932_06690 [Gluconobacter oxydans]
MTPETTTPTNKGGADLARPTCDDHMAGQAARERREMTDEQNKPVRSREEQISALWDALAEGKSHPNSDIYSNAAAAHVDEAEARGAAQQRRKDGEGQEPVAWIDASELPERGNNMGTSEASLSPRKTHYETTPLYTHPANVAALEGRIAELEGALKEAAIALEQVKDGERGGYRSRNGKFVSIQMSDGERADIIHSDVTTECERALEIARAALKREGGV